MCVDGYTRRFDLNSNPHQTFIVRAYQKEFNATKCMFRCNIISEIFVAHLWYN